MLPANAVIYLTADRWFGLAVREWHQVKWQPTDALWRITGLNGAGVLEPCWPKRWCSGPPAVLLRCGIG